MRDKFVNTFKNLEKEIRHADNVILSSMVTRALVVTGAYFYILYVLLREEDIPVKPLLFSTVFWLLALLYLIYLTVQSSDSIKVVGICVEKTPVKTFEIRRFKKFAPVVKCTVKSIEEPLFTALD